MVNSEKNKIDHRVHNDMKLHTCLMPAIRGCDMDARFFFNEIRMHLWL